MPCIYIIRNKKNGKCYVGQTGNIYKRFKRHKYKSKVRNLKISAAVRKYGMSSFEKFIFYVPENFLDYFETEMIKRLFSVEKGYNLDSGGHANKHLSEETKNKISMAGKGRVAWNKGKRGLQVAWNKGKSHVSGWHHSKETIEHLREVNTGEGNPMFGKRPSEETRKKLSAARKGKSNHMFGKHHSEETKRKISESMKTTRAST